jgi:ribosomal protein S18 acetylase RimI-like enzyme
MRQAQRQDIEHLVALNRAAYPDLVQEGVVWDAEQIRSHLDRFANGQLVAFSEGVLVGAISTLVLPPTFDTLAPHTWMDATGHGYFTTHDPNGTTLYLADVYVHPAFQGRGVGSALYDGLKALCISHGLANVVAGGRLWGFAEVANRMTAEEYVAKVRAGEIFDRVLVSQLRAGFSVRGLLPGYLNDPKSMNWATLLEWKNPTRSVRERSVRAIVPEAPSVEAR